MNWKTWLLLILALAAGSVASFGVKTAFFTEKDARINAEKDDFTPKERLLVANGVLAAGTELNAQNVRLTLTSERDAPRDGIFTFDGIAGRKITRDLDDGEPISLYDLEASEEVQTEDVSFVPPGFVVVPIEICSATKANGGVNYLKTTKLDRLVKPGDVVDLVVVKEDVTSREKRRLISDSVAEDVSVFAVSDENRRTSEGATRNSILSALLSKEQVESVRKASEEGKIKVVFNSASDLSFEEQQEQDDFLNGGVYLSLENNDAALGRAPDALLSDFVQTPGRAEVKKDSETDFLDQSAGKLDENSVAESDKADSGVFMNVSRTVKVDESEDEASNEAEDSAYDAESDLLSNSDVIVGDEKSEKLLIDDEVSERTLDERTDDESFPGNESGDLVLPTEVFVAEELDDSDKGNADDGVEAYALQDSKDEGADGAGGDEKRPRIVSPYVTRGTNVPQRKEPEFRERPKNVPQDRVF